MRKHVHMLRGTRIRTHITHTHIYNTYAYTYIKEQVLMYKHINAEIQSIYVRKYVFMYTARKLCS